ncbi:MAG TPA: hypothetical protein VKB48_12605 [Candidatus Acidoferrum sp.]|nr:hypothetical protein [Candidatus Acidoferrum sp.]
MEIPLLKLDPEIKQFARTQSISSKNYHDCPERSLVLMEGTVSRLIHIYLESEKTLTLNVWLCASEERGNEPFWKKQFLRKDALAEQILTDIKSLLQEVLNVAQSWKGTNLEFATKLKWHS